MVETQEATGKFAQMGLDLLSRKVMYTHDGFPRLAPPQQARPLRKPRPERSTDVQTNHDRSASAYMRSSDGMLFNQIAKLLEKAVTAEITVSSLTATGDDLLQHPLTFEAATGATHFVLVFFKELFS